MARVSAVRDQDQSNLWGKSKDLHRTDLWYVDLHTAFYAINDILGDTPTPEVEPQHVQSVSLPAINKVRAEQVRRDSIPYPMPSWDECIEPITITFFLESVTPNPVIVLLERWASLVRAGRGRRLTSGGTFKSGNDRFNTQLELDANYSTTFQFPIHIYLLQGKIAASLSAGQADIISSNISRATQNTVVGSLFAPASATLRSLSANLFNDFCRLERIQSWTAKVWLSGYHTCELDYKNTNLATVTATFQPEYIRMESTQ